MGTQRCGVEGVHEKRLSSHSIRGDPFGKLLLETAQFGVEFFVRGLPCLQFAGEASLHDSILRLRPFVDVIGRIQECLERVIIPLRERLELVVVAFGALESQAQQAGAHDLHLGFERVVTIGAHFVRIAIAFTGAVLSVSQVVGGFEQFNDFRCGGLAGRPAGQFVAGDLLAHKLIERLVAIEGPDHVIPITPCQRSIGVAVKIPIGICIARGIEPDFSPPFAEARRIQIAADHPFVSIPLQIRRKLLDFLEGRRKSGQDECDAPDQGRAIGFSRQVQALLLQFARNKPVNRLLCVPLGDSRRLQGLKRPVRRARFLLRGGCRDHHCRNSTKDQRQQFRKDRLEYSRETAAHGPAAANNRGAE